jgi:hypothetical protein
MWADLPPCLNPRNVLAMVSTPGGTMLQLVTLRAGVKNMGQAGKCFEYTVNIPRYLAADDPQAPKRPGTTYRCSCGETTGTCCFSVTSCWCHIIRKHRMQGMKHGPGQSISGPMAKCPVATGIPSAFRPRTGQPQPTSLGPQLIS